MPDIKILTEAELRDLVPLDADAVDCVEQGFTTLAGGKVVMPPIMTLPVPDHKGEVCVKTAYVPGIDSFAMKMSPGFFDNPKLGLPSTTGLMVVFSSRTGLLEALLLDNGYLTDVRTAAAGAVAARHLARADASRVCIIGAGVQARMQLKAMTLVRGIQNAVIWARESAKAEAAAASLRSELGIDVTAAADIAQAVAGADIVVTTTPAADPVVQAEWLRPGQLVIAMGSDQEHKCELEPACLTKADLYVPDSQAQCAVKGELRSAIAAGLIAGHQSFTELGAITSGQAPGRQSDNELIIADLTGTGVQDTAIATLAGSRADAAGAGATFTS
ncbi:MULTISPECIES: ectoine utilization protein EutC [unclassified Leisingera]|uniref:ectoine utilization protein EutC n=1 Tax=unclassified Leisingera TaxID=2614906 RepID=UPI0003027F04|nr:MULTISPECIES: ectoine utilization protein EutC [unclassified Leisingera]KIC23760.1 ectoine utilization protein EutC [Leisingera sp. ANG-S3]KIC29553.1 ectoine utilization protein EutC [Leisingera sp. ANG-S5]KIC50666.1 ectoine utilization protein EutC [Leisingera sp. ANG-S]KID09899.1 ectoine utilization protein EutC [Leisingera sp. ANG1]